MFITLSVPYLFYNTAAMFILLLSVALVQWLACSPCVEEDMGMHPTSDIDMKDINLKLALYKYGPYIYFFSYFRLPLLQVRTWQLRE